MPCTSAWGMLHSSVMNGSHGYSALGRVEGVVEIGGAGGVGAVAEASSGVEKLLEGPNPPRGGVAEPLDVAVDLEGGGETQPPVSYCPHPTVPSVGVISMR